MWTLVLMLTCKKYMLILHVQYGQFSACSLLISDTQYDLIMYTEVNRKILLVPSSLGRFDWQLENMLTSLVENILFLSGREIINICNLYRRHELKVIYNRQDVNILPKMK